ncbi:PREDICTED: serine/threonine-protein kinase prp4-like isoform X2 [Papilio xuthus]|nr:PREDICTED: serine/threonine-protein kinase prp4-like isoform X2 [Papilio xuthus]
MTSKRYFSTYQSSNIVIDPNKSLLYSPIAKKIKMQSKKPDTNLRNLQDNQMQKTFRQMDPSRIKKENEDNLNKPIKSEICIKNTALCKIPNKSNTILTEENITAQIKLEDNYETDNSQTENVLSVVTSGGKINSNGSKKINVNCEKQNSKNNNFNNCLLPSTIKTELNNNFDSNMTTFNKKMNCSNEQLPKLTYSEDNKITTKNVENTDRNKGKNTFQHKIKVTKEETRPKQFKEATKKNRVQVNRKYATKVAKHKNEQPKKIKITINITYNNLNSKKNQTSTNTNVDGDLSFLDDFDVDEVVESLFNSKEQNNPIIKTNINIEEEITENSKKRKTSNTNNKESTKQTTRVDNKTEETKKANIEKEKSQANITTNNNRGKNDNREIDCSIIAKKTESKIISTDSKKDLQEIKKEVCSKEVKSLDTGHNINKKHNNSLGILNKFVTKSDIDLARNLEMKMYDTLKEKYSVLAVTYYGKFSKIFKCIDTSGHYYAVKILDNPATNLKGKKKDNILLELKKDIPEENLHCIHLLHSFKIDKHICHMTNYYPINLEQVLTDKKFRIEEIQFLAKQLVEAVTVLRSKNIVHHDIKPSHILLDNKAQKLTLCGFDEAIIYIYSDNLKTNIGTINYASPEKILGYSYGFPVDIWSTALVIYEMATNTMLFTGTTDNEVLFQQMSVLGDIPEKIIKESRFKNAHFCGTTFIKKGLNQDPDVRINNFVKNNNIYSAIIAAQYAREDIVGREKRNIDIKLQSLIRLLGKMLTIDPRKRLTIEYVYADNFFFRKTN